MDTVTEDVTIAQQQFILDELERVNALIRRMIDRGLVTPADQAHAQLTLDIKRLERKIHVLDAAGQDVTDLRNQLSACKMELEIVDSMPSK